MRNCIACASAVAASRRCSSRWIAVAAATAALPSWNIASTESPVMSMTRPPPDWIWMRNTSRASSSARTVARASCDIRRE